MDKLIGLIVVLSLCGLFWGISKEPHEKAHSIAHRASQEPTEAFMERFVSAVRMAEGNVNYGLVNDEWCLDADACRYYAKEVLRVHALRCSNDIQCIGGFYAPLGASNDSQGLNYHWVRNVEYWMEKLS